MENINILEIIKQCPEGMVFYCPIIGDCTVEITESALYPLKGNPVNGNDNKVGLTAEGRYLSGVGDCILFPSKDQRDWSKFIIPEPDLPIDTPVAVSDDGKWWELRLYSGRGCAKLSKYITLDKPWNYITPLNMMDFTTNGGFTPKENYGIASRIWEEYL